MNKQAVIYMALGAAALYTVLKLFPETAKQTGIVEQAPWYKFW